MKITDYPEAQDIQEDDVLIIDGENGTKQAKVKTFFETQEALSSYDPAIAHRNIFRGKNLGYRVTEEQIAHIHDGSFKDLYVGDYWEIGDIRYFIADINWFAPLRFQNGEHHNHLVIVTDADTPDPDFNVQWATELLPTNGYRGSKVKEIIDALQKPRVETAFYPATILPVYTHQSNKINLNSGNESGLDIWVASYLDTVNLLTLGMISGNTTINRNWGSNYINAMNNGGSQLALFRLSPEHAFGKETNCFWVQDIVGYTASRASSDNIVCVGGYAATSTPNSYEYGDVPIWIRSYFCIG